MTDQRMSTQELKDAYEDQRTDKDRMDFIAFHQRQLTARLDVIESMLHDIGQKVTDTDAFAKEARAAAEGMRNNPMMRMLGAGKAAPPILGMPH